MTPDPDPDHFLILSPHARHVWDGALLRVIGPLATIEVGGIAPALRGAFDSVAHGAPASALHLPDAVVEALIAHQLLARIALEPEHPAQFLRDFLAVCDVWALDIFHSRFWLRFLAGQSNEEEVLLFLAQLYHRTVGADVHNRLAFQRCQIRALGPLLEQHYREERGHASILADGLRRCGRRGAALLRAKPLPATRRLIAYMVALSAQPFRYLGCYGILHAPATVRSEAELQLQFAQFARMYPFAAPGFKAVCQHARIDYQLGHDRIMLDRWLRTRPPQAVEVAALLRGAHGAARAFRPIFDAIASGLPYGTAGCARTQLSTSDAF